MGSTDADQNGLRALFDKRVHALARDLPRASEGDVEAVHRSRVAARRPREALPFLQPRFSRRKLRYALEVV